MSRSIAPNAPLETAIYLELRQRIIALELKPGTMVYENAIAAEHGVSRTPVRQAMAKLTHEGLLVVLPQRGAMISRLSASKLTEAQFVREALEMRAFMELGRIWDAAGEHAAIHSAAQALIERQKAVVAGRDYLGFIELDVQFHNVLISALGNATLLDSLDSVRVHLTRLRYLELTEAMHELDAIADHEELLRLLALRDAAGATDKLLRHLRLLEHERAKMIERHPELF